MAHLTVKFNRPVLLIVLCLFAIDTFAQQQSKIGFFDERTDVGKPAI